MRWWKGAIETKKFHCSFLVLLHQLSVSIPRQKYRLLDETQSLQISKQKGFSFKFSRLIMNGSIKTRNITSVCVRETNHYNEKGRHFNFRVKSWQDRKVSLDEYVIKANLVVCFCDLRDFQKWELLLRMKWLHFLNEKWDVLRSDLWQQKCDFTRNFCGIVEAFESSLNKWASPNPFVTQKS